MMNRLAIASAALLLTAPFAAAGPIDSACNASSRAAANRALCGCIQQVANMTLSNADQRRAAGFFRNPHQAQEVRMSKSNADNAFWGRYKQFADTAQRYCAR